MKMDIDRHGPRQCSTSVKILTHIISRYHLPLKVLSLTDFVYFYNFLFQVNLENEHLSHGDILQTTGRGNILVKKTTICNTPLKSFFMNFLMTS
jgi:hypothetical protein